MTKPSIPQNIFNFVVYFLAQYLRYCLILIFVGFIWAIDVSLGPYLIKLILDAIEKTSEQENLFLLVIKPASLYVFLRLFMNGLYRLHDYCDLKFTPKFKQDITLTILNYIQNHSHAYFQKKMGGSIVTGIAELANGAHSIVKTVIENFFPHFTALMIACYTMSTVDIYLGTTLFIWAIGFMLGSYFLSKQPYQLAQNLSKKNISFYGKLMDSIVNMLAVRLFARKNYEYRYLSERSQRKTQAAEQLGWSILKRRALMETSSNILVGFLIFYLIYARQRGMVTVGDFALILTLSISMIDAIWDISQDFLEFTENIGQCSQTLRMLTTPHEITDVPDAKILIVKNGSIDFQNVYFSYQQEGYLFENFSIHIGARKKIGLVGHSGSGKTTFVNLISRLFDIQSGKIVIDGQDITQVTQDSLHENISFIPQEPLLFHRNLLENIRYGRVNATDEEVIEAAIKANIHPFINKLPEGYRTRIGEKGITLSGGQRQRIAIARAILKNAPILILDEATSALDSETEQLIQKSLYETMEGKTVLVIAHRLSTLMYMDRILVFQGGKIIEEGSHLELLIKKGHYAHFWTLQAQKSVLPENV